MRTIQYFLLVFILILITSCFECDNAGDVIAHRVNTMTLNFERITGIENNTFITVPLTNTNHDTIAYDSLIMKITFSYKEVTRADEIKHDSNLEDNCTPFERAYLDDEIKLIILTNRSFNKIGKNKPINTILHLRKSLAVDANNENFSAQFFNYMLDGFQHPELFVFFTVPPNNQSIRTLNVRFKDKNIQAIEQESGSISITN